MTYGSTSKNIHILTLSITLLAVLGLFAFEFTYISVLITVISFYALNILGNWMMLHRYYAHKSFTFKYELVRKLFTVLTVLAGRGSPLGWSYIHRQHHAYSDTEKDPHSPKHLGFKLFGFGHYKGMEQEQMKLFLVKDLMDQEQLFIHKYYILIVLGLIAPVAIYDIQLLYFLWILPAFLVHISQNMFNYIGHMYGYRNFETKDDSRNCVWLFPLILGEAWHNNHHGNAKSCSTTHSKYELDPLMTLVSLVRK
jgi:fatty-acid desaturase